MHRSFHALGTHELNNDTRGHQAPKEQCGLTNAIHENDSNEQTQKSRLATAEKCKATRDFTTCI